MGGDFNAKHTAWGSRLVTTKGRELNQAATELSCSFLSTGEPTYWPTDLNKTPDVIDFFVSKNINSKYTQIESNFDLQIKLYIE